jgi:demethylmenaquinone methyltransferase / 2-methoxy-6-polyprenyl-1,4-benzoquinol methylase
MRADPSESPSSAANAAAFAFAADDVFGRIAKRYDFLSDVFSFGIHRLWKRRVAKVIADEHWTTLLDGATGTADIILRVLAHESVQGRSIVAADISPQMLAIAQTRLSRHTDRVGVRQLNAEAMTPVPSDSVDAYSISLCLKICNRTLALREALRVLKPGGRIVVLEASNIPWGSVHAAYLAYMHLCMPMLGWLATGGDASAYRYLLHGIRDFPSAEALAVEMTNAGFTDVRFERLSFGIVAIHVGRKPTSPSDGL